MNVTVLNETRGSRFNQSICSNIKSDYHFGERDDESILRTEEDLIHDIGSSSSKTNNYYGKGDLKRSID